jgi:hypothetical protein
VVAFGLYYTHLLWAPWVPFLCVLCGSCGDSCFAFVWCGSYRA